MSIRNAKQSKRGLIRRSCGDQWISCSVVAASQCRRPLTSRLLISSSPTKLPTCAYPPTMRRHQHLLTPQPDWRWMSSVNSPSMMSPVQSDSFLTKALPPTQYRPSFWSRPSTYLLHSSPSCLTVHWRLVTFLAGLRTRPSRQLSRRRDLIPLKPVLTGQSLIFQCYQSSCNDSLRAG